MAGRALACCGAAARSEVVGLKTFSRLFQAVGTVGLTGLDRLYSFMNVRELQRFTDLYRRVLKAEKGMHQFLAAFAAELEPVTSMPHNAAKMYAAAVGKASKFFPIYNGAAWHGVALT